MCEGILKILMFIINSVIFFGGAAMLVMGVWIELNKKQVLAALLNSTSVPPEIAQLASVSYMLMAVGAVLGIMGFLGCCGTCCENKCMLMAYFLVILFVFVAEVVAAVIVLLYQPVANKLLDKIRAEVANSIKKNFGKNDMITAVWNNMMEQLKCCGYNNYTDFITGAEIETHNVQVPQFCCATTHERCNGQTSKLKLVDGCFDTVVKLLKGNAALLGGVAICVAAIEVAAMIMSLILLRSKPGNPQL